MNPAAPKATESDLESAISAAIGLAFPWLSRAAIRHQFEFTIRLGKQQITPSGRESWVARGRADILLLHNEKPLAILELKRPGLPLQPQDGSQGLSYARLLQPSMAPLVVVTNGADSRIIDTFTGNVWNPATTDEAAFEALMKNAGLVAFADRRRAIETLMGSDPGVWTAAITSASEEVLAELSATSAHPALPFGPLKIPRAATAAVLDALSAARLVVLSGAPLSGKTNALGDLAKRFRGDKGAALYIERGAGGIYQRVADILARTLDWPVSSEEARNWLRQISHFDGPQLLLVIDDLNPDDPDDRRIVEELSSPTFGDRLGLVIALDDGAAVRMLQVPTARGPSTIGRRAKAVSIGPLDPQEFRGAVLALASINMGIMEGGQYSSELRQPWFLQALATRLAAISGSGVGVFPSVPGVEVLAQARIAFPDPELRRRYRDLTRALVADAQDNSRPPMMALQLTSRFFIRRKTVNAYVTATDVTWLLQNGYLTPAIGEGNTPIVSVAVPELLASELAFNLADDLGPLVRDDPVLAAKWLSGAASNFLFGDIIAAQAVFDLAERTKSISFTLYAALANTKPVLVQHHAGQVLAAWIEGVGQVDLRPQEDGSTVAVIDGVAHLIEPEPDAGAYENIHAWLILSHLASRRCVVNHGAGDERVDAHILLTIGQAELILRQPRNDLAFDTLPVHDGPNGGQFVCHNAGIVEAVTIFMLRYLNHESREDAEALIRRAMGIDSVYLTARLDIALRTLARSNRPEMRQWAANQLEHVVTPAFLRHMPDH